MTRRSYKTGINTCIYTRLCRQLYEIENNIRALTQGSGPRQSPESKRNEREALQRYYSAYAATSKALDILEERT